MNFLKQYIKQSKASENQKMLNFSVDNIALWADELSLHREDIYSDDGNEPK